MESYLRVDFIYDNHRLSLLYGLPVDENSLDELWPKRPGDMTLLENPLDPTNSVMPFQGKYVMLFEVKATSQRLDTYLSTEFDKSISRSLWQKYIKAGYVLVNGEVEYSTKASVDELSKIEVSIPEFDHNDKNELPIIYEDDDVIVINKPEGVLTHAKGGISDEYTVATMLSSRVNFNDTGDRPGIVHRLDRDTSGVIIGARNTEAATHLQKQFADRKVEKTYIAVVEGTPKINKAIINLPIGRNPSKPSTFRVDSNGKSAETFYEVLASNEKHSLVKLSPKTGRTHQLRVHMAHIGNPIVGDRIYGRKSLRLMLHAKELRLMLLSGKEQTFVSKVPVNFLEEFPGYSL